MSIDEPGAEWLVTDRSGAFAMGTREGYRVRKYHGFLMGVAGRSETAYLVDLDITCNGRKVWPHSYAGSIFPVIHPDLQEDGISIHYEHLESGPKWTWKLPGGKLQFAVRAVEVSGIELSWKWTSRTSARLAKKAKLSVRPFWAMRDLHALGGTEWSWQESDSRMAVIRGPQDSRQGARDAVCILSNDGWKWKREPIWYERFHYSEEAQRGYPANENLYSDGIIETELVSGKSAHWILGLKQPPMSQDLHLIGKSKLFDFVLQNPPGIVAGFPWFGEWGRDTFISLPGIVSTTVKSKSKNDIFIVERWASDLLARWGEWIEKDGMLPNVLGKEKSAQWDSADAALWWCHSIAALWSLTLAVPFLFKNLEEEAGPLLDQAIESIRNGKHRFLHENTKGVLEVSGGDYATWMDARVSGVAVTPRTGALPEINALWFQARCLQWLWNDHAPFSELEELGNQVLQCREEQRPNTVFLHSLPLAPSFVLRKWEVLKQDVKDLTEKFWTPVGLRTLAPTEPEFHKRCVGDQTSRDRAYHQGPVWAWLGGHFEMAKERSLKYGWMQPHELKPDKIKELPPKGGRFFAGRENSIYKGSLDLPVSGEDCASHPVQTEKMGSDVIIEKMFSRSVLARTPVVGHIPEIFDAESPFISRGAPAQAWSLACWEEARIRRQLKLDGKLEKIIKQRRQSEVRRENASSGATVGTQSL